MLSAAGHVFSLLKRKVEKTTAHYLGHDVDLQDVDAESDLTIREINNLAKNLMFNGSLTTEEKEELVSKIGHLAYMGAPEAGRTAATCLNEMITLLKSRSTSETFKDKIVMAISEICYLNRDNQNRAVAALPVLVEMMGNISPVHRSRLACYCITCLVCNNYTMLIQLQDVPELKENLLTCRNVRSPWTGWSDNYADLLIDILYSETSGASHLLSSSYRSDMTR
ncbi:armadillo-like helical domain-containing protein 2 [Watersipora subatra]|uniref:armadillo-like helical domain-containing protein 2 n=1 Tax=Watersipora subatra TaxID=2589382 RepID=UPI00355BB889